MGCHRPCSWLVLGYLPSGVTFCYCIVDSVAMGGAALLLMGLKYAGEWVTSGGSSPARTGRWAVLLGLREHAREDIQSQIRLTSRAISTSLRSPELVVEPIDKT
jgi:hypothetical protein